MEASLLTVGEVARRAQLSVPTLHYYERLGLLTKPTRSASNYRLYRPDTLGRIEFIKKAHGLGFTLEEIKDILSLRDHGCVPCRRVAELGARRLEEIDRQLARLRAIRRALAAVLPKWQEETRGRRRCTGEFCDFIERLPEQ